MLRGMCDVVRAVTAIRLALAARRDLLLEMLALHHQLAVLARSNRRFRTADRLLWLFLRRMWSQWHDALLLIQPATVDRWHRDRFDRRWWRRSRRPGRPRIDSQVRDLIQRLADENRLWGAPRIHGELLKLGVVVSERTVSRYLHGRPRTPSQTWRTFLANHLGQIAFIDDIVSPDASGDNVVGPLAGAWRSTSSPHWRCESIQCSLVDRTASVQRTCVGGHFTQNHGRYRTDMRRSTGRSPPPDVRAWPFGAPPTVARVAATDGHRPNCARPSACTSGSDDRPFASIALHTLESTPSRDVLTSAPAPA